MTRKLPNRKVLALAIAAVSTMHAFAADDIKIESGGVFGANLTLTGMRLEADSISIGTAAANSGNLTIDNWDTTWEKSLSVNGDITIAQGGSLDLLLGNISAANIINNGRFTRTQGGVELTSSDMHIGSGQLLGANVVQSLGEKFGSDNLILEAGSSFTQSGGRNVVDGVIQLNSSSVYTINYGGLSLGHFDNQGGSFVWNGGNLTHNDAMIIGSGQVLSGAVDLNDLNYKDLTVGSSLTVQAGSQIAVSGYRSLAAESLILETGSAATLSGGSLAVDHIDIQGGAFVWNGGHLVDNDAMIIGSGQALSGLVNLDSTKALTVGSSLTVQAGSEISVSQGIGYYGAVVGLSAQSLILELGSTATLNGGSLSVDHIDNQGGTFVFNSGSLNHNDAMIIGTGQALSGLVNLDSSKNLTVGSSLNVQAGSEIAINGGYLSVGHINNQGGTFVFNSGSLQHNDAMIIGSGQALSGLVNLDSSKALSVGSSLTIQAGSEIAINGGYLSVGHIDNQGGTFVFNSGSLQHNDAMIIGSGQVLSGLVNLDGRDLLVGSSLTIQAGSEIDVSSYSNLVAQSLILESGSAAKLNGGVLSVDHIDKQGGTFVFNSGILNHSDSMIIGSGQALSGLVNLDSSKILNAQTSLTIQAGSQIAINGGSLYANEIINNGGFSFTSGYLNLGQGNLGASSYLGTSLSLTDSKRLSASNFTVDSGASLSVNGSQYISNLQNNGQLQVVTGGSLQSNTIENSGAIFVREGSLLEGNLIQTAGTTRVMDHAIVNGNILISGGTLRSGGLIDGDLEIGSAGTLDVGDSFYWPETLVTGLTTLNSGSIVNFTVKPDDNWDSLISNDFVFNGGTINFNLGSNFTIEQFLLINSNFGNFFYSDVADNIHLDMAAQNLSFFVKSATGSQALGMDAEGNFSAVPVPASAWLMGSGLIGLIGAARRKRVH
jgi:filamentous hemagglutinin